MNDPAGARAVARRCHVGVRKGPQAMQWCTGGARGRTASIVAGVFVGLLVIVGLMGATRAEAASIGVSWNAPTTNADGSRLTDLASYRIYLATSPPACPSASYFTVASPTSSPTSGQTMSSRVTALTAGTTYYARVTAVDTSGNESAC